MKKLFVYILYWIPAIAPLISILPRTYVGQYLNMLIFASIMSLIIDYFSHRVSPSKKLLCIVPALIFVLYCRIMWGAEEIATLYANGTLYFLCALFCYCVLADKVQKRVFVLSSVLGVHLVGVMSLLQFFGILPTSIGGSIYTYYGGTPFIRSTALFPHATTLGLYLYFNLPLLVKEYVGGKQLDPLIISSLFFAMAGISTSFGRTVYVLSIFLIIVCMSVWFLRFTRINFRIFLFLIIGLCIVVGLSSYLTDNNELARRFSRAFDWSGASAQRWGENQLGLSLIKEKWWGYGSNNIKKIIDEVISKKIQSGESWEFTEWRGAHNFILDIILNWGVPGLMLFFLYTLLPIIVNKQKSLQPSAVVTILFTLSLLLFSLTDSFLYTEIVILLAAILWILPLPGSGEWVRPKFSHLILIGMILVFSFFIPKIRTLTVDLVAMNRVYLDNPSQKTILVKVDENEIAIPGGGYRVWNTSKSSISILIDNKTYNWNLKPLLPKEKKVYFISLAGGGDYKEVNFFYNNKTSELIEIFKETPYNRAKFLYLLPDWMQQYSLGFFDSPATLAGLIHQKRGKEIFIDANAKRIVRIGAPNVDLIDCWEPFWYLLLGDSNFSTCGWRTSRTGYGNEVFITQRKYLAEIRNIVMGLQKTMHKGTD